MIVKFLLFLPSLNNLIQLQSNAKLKHFQQKNFLTVFYQEKFKEKAYSSFFTKICGGNNHYVEKIAPWSTQLHKQIFQSYVLKYESVHEISKVLLLRQTIYSIHYTVA